MADYKGLAIGKWGGIAETETEFKGGIQIQSGQFLRFSAPPSSEITTGMETGDLFLQFENTTSGAKLAVCVDAGNQSVRYIPFGTATYGRETP